jgi:zona occludens toxin
VKGPAGVHYLLTGLNGHGKTLYCVAEVLRPIAEDRRLVVGGIPELLLQHDVLDVPELDPETFTDEWGKEDRKPGDVIVIDEAQRVFRPMAHGRRVPRFIARLETARHYGVQFVYMTQHPMLLHSNVRSLVGPHEHARRIFGRSAVALYTWDRCSNPDRVRNASMRTWKHDKSAFGLYRSSQQHTKFATRLPMAAMVAVGALLALPFLGWQVYGVWQRVNAPVPGSVAAGGPGVSSASGGVGGGHAWPVLTARLEHPIEEPLEGRGVEWEGGYKIDGRSVQFFGLVVDGARVATVTLSDLNGMGYRWVQLGPCVGTLTFRGLVRHVTCAAPRAPGAVKPSPSASAPVA